jgi:hypothetical protein
MATKVMQDGETIYLCYAGEKYQRTVEQVVVNSIRNAFQDQAEGILRELSWYSNLGCYGFTRDAIFFGIETDGHCHT